MASLGRIAVSGSTGFIGSKLCETLRNVGYEIWPLVRAEVSDPNAIFYDYYDKKIDSDKLSKCDVVIHLAGKNIMSGVWTKKCKQEIYDSRVVSTRFLAHSLSKLSTGPKTLLAASAIGIYGDRADQKLDEETGHGVGFLAKLCVDWERGVLFAKEAGLRVVNMRFGGVLDKDGGMLKMIEPIFKLGLGGVVGNGEQFFSYVTLKDLIRQIMFLLEKPKISGPVNMTAYEPTTNKEFTKALGRVLSRPTFLRTPAFLLKLLGDQGEMFLSSARVYPKVLLDNEFAFGNHQSIESVLIDLYFGRT